MPLLLRLSPELLDAEERLPLERGGVGVERAQLLELAQPVLRRRGLRRQPLEARERDLLEDDLVEQLGEVLDGADARVLVG